MDKKNIVIGALIVIIALAIWGLMSKSVVVVPTPDGTVGAIPGYDLMSSYINLNGVTQFPYSQKMTQGTTTPCAFVPSWSATTTLVRATAGFNIASTAATEITWGKAARTSATSTNLTATTTELGVKALAAGAKGSFTLTATTSNNGQLDSDLATVFAPGDAIVLSIAGGDTTGDTSPVGLKPSGNCNFLFEEIKN